MSKKGRQWTWESWEQAIKSARGGNYATASVLAAMIFFGLLSAAIMMRAVAPTPPDIDEFPMLLAKRVAAREILQHVYLVDCELAAVASIPEPFRALAKQTGLYSPEAFPAALACIDERLLALGVGGIERQLRSTRTTQPLLDLNCFGDLRQGELCTRAFAYAQNRGRLVGLRLAERLGAAESPELR